jgi:hypothetical protein
MRSAATNAGRKGMGFIRDRGVEVSLYVLSGAFFVAGAICLGFLLVP